MNELDKMLWKIKKEMKEKGINQTELVNNLGLGHNTISNILNGKNGTFSTLKKILDYIDNKGE